MHCPTVTELPIRFLNQNGIQPEAAKELMNGLLNEDVDPEHNFGRYEASGTSLGTLS